MFTFFATVVQQLDVIPALGSSLWTVISTFVMVAVVRDPFPAFLHNLPLFSLAIANAALLGLQVPRDFSNRASHATSLADSRAIGQVMGFVAYRFREGKLECVTSRGSEIRHWCFTFHAMSTPDQAKEVHNGIVENGYSFINGRNLNLFRDVFIAWRRQAQSVVERVNRRRIFCLAGLLCESVAVIVVISLIGNIQGSGSNMFGSFETASSTSGIPYFTSPLEFSLLQVVLSVIVICFSDYLYILVNISRSVTCETEVRAIMLHCVSSRWFNWAGSDYSYLENGRRLRGLNIHFDEASIPVKELPLLGFFGDQDESERCNATILTNAANSKQILIRRVGESLLRASLYNGEADRQTLLNEKLENIAIEVSDRIV
ncbi:unnamed protein product [Chondrus crispus]|uniref:Uncharacterized protein n=1 Tax=Chondrus crispus TaxID=2769 RepID=R7QB00_CHOCR|nr:unnamed protein product [Chondrus crispus]CDF35249.1 unnamed protein product [Chondrus crispus]|eukprot:XP_005715068.1 unnamed protein product [Chondrus crispus]